MTPASSKLLSPLCLTNADGTTTTLRNRLIMGSMHTGTGFNDVVGKTPLLTPADVRRKKIRVSPAPSSQFFWTGYSPEQILALRSCGAAG